MEAIRLWKYQGYKTLVTLSLYVLGTSLCLMSQEKLNCSPRFANVRMSSFITQTNQQNPAKAGNPTNTLDYFFPQKCVETVYWYMYIYSKNKKVFGHIILTWWGEQLSDLIRYYFVCNPYSSQRGILNPSSCGHESWWSHNPVTTVFSSQCSSFLRQLDHLTVT